ncbi:MAG: short-chain dehydrogenase [Bacteroidota bacterium]
MPEKISYFQRLWSILSRQHRRNREKGVYGYMWWTALKIVLIWFLIMVPLVLLLKYLIDLEPVFRYITEDLPNYLVWVVFLVSESFLGLMPPDIFIIWAGKFDSTLLIITLLGILSYIGGIISYYIGHWLSITPKIKAYSERALNKYIVLSRKWGGAFIIISSLFPFSPFSMIVIAVSLLRYPFKLYLFFGVSRILRFIVQGILYLKILNVDNFFNLL